MARAYPAAATWTTAGSEYGFEAPGMPTGMPTMRGRPIPLFAFALVLAAGGIVGMAYAAGWHHVLSTLGHVTLGWVLIALAAQIVALLAYVPSYRTFAGIDGGTELQWRMALELVVAGFGAFVPGGGLAHDKRALTHIDGDARASAGRILGLGALEYAVIAPAAWLAAVVLLPEHNGIQRAILWSWAICVPLGTVLALLALHQRKRLTRDGHHRRTDQALCGLQHLLDLIRARHVAPGFGGMLGYWAAEAVSLYAAGRALGFSLGLGQLILGLATGWALTRRSMPLAGAGAMMVFMSLALHWVGVSLVTAVAMVVVYHLAGLILPGLAALWARHSLEEKTRPAV
jgi:uncharacterized membrane protein YbhN (UPF0104 family)